MIIQVSGYSIVEGTVQLTVLVLQDNLEPLDDTLNSCVVGINIDKITTRRSFYDEITKAMIAVYSRYLKTKEFLTDRTITINLHADTITDHDIAGLEGYKRAYGKNDIE